MVLPVAFDIERVLSSWWIKTVCWIKTVLVTIIQLKLPKLQFLIIKTAKPSSYIANSFQAKALVQMT